LLALTSHQEAAPHLLKMAILWDNEEVGSRTAQGADSPFLQHVLERITCLLDMPREDLFRLSAQSLCVSVDLAHAINPNYPAKHEPHHQVQLGAGVVLKVHSNQRYATDAVSASFISEICRSQQIPLQTFASRSDIPCGSTVGPINAARTGIKTVDIGCPQLSMHSSRETICCKDQLAMNQLLHAVLQGFD
jgi:aspartyl aminopeptidase